MPGIVVSTSVRTGPSTVNQNPAATFFVVGQTQRGPAATPKLVTSIADYEAVYGEYVSYGQTHQQVQTFFEEGGAQVYVSRVVGASATAGSLTLVDSSAGNSINLTAVGEGDWTSGLSVDVLAIGSGVSIRFFLNGELVYATGEVGTVTTAVNRINNSAVAARYVTAAAAGLNLPTVVSGAGFSSGTDDRANITTSTYIDALTNFDLDLGPGAVAIPGENGSTIWEALAAHAHAYNRIALLGLQQPSLSYTSIDAGADGAAFGSTDGAEYSAMFWPWITMTNDAGTSLTISPEGYVAAKRSVALNTVGSWQPYAGAISQSRFITGLSDRVDRNVGDYLDEYRVNALRIIDGAVRIYGARSLSVDEDNYRFLNSRETLNYVVYQSQRALEDLVFSPIDGRQSLFAKVEAQLVFVLEPLRIAGGLFEAFDATGRRIDNGYTVQVNDAINPVSQLAGGLVRAKVGIRVSGVGDLIQVDVTKSNLTASVV
jgi:hypothetical protein